MKIRKARIWDAEKIHLLIEPFASKGEMLHRSISEICENLRDYFVAEEDGQLIGCCALHVNTPDLAEIKALAVAPGAQGKGVGTALVEACIEEAKELGVATVFVLTYRPPFFERMGFRRVEKSTLPHKVWKECICCNKFPICGEEALILPVLSRKEGDEFLPQ